MKRFHHPRILLVLVLALILTLPPFSRAMADSSYFEFDASLTSAMEQTLNDNGKQWFDSSDYRAMLAACLILDVGLENDGMYDMDWNYPVVLAKDSSDYYLLYIDDGGNICDVVYLPSSGSGIYAGATASYVESTFNIDTDGWPKTSIISYASTFGSGIDDLDFISYDDFDYSVNAIIELLSGDGNDSGSTSDSNTGANSVPNDGGHYLPSPDAWFGNNIAESQSGWQDEYVPSNGSGVRGNYYFKSFTLNLDDLPALEAYVELLKDERFGLRYMDSHVDEYPLSQSRYTNYEFDSRDGTVPIHTMIDGESSGAVVIMISEYLDESRCSLSIYYDSAFRFIDVGDVYPYADGLTDRSGKSSSNGNSYSGSSSSSSSSGSSYSFDSSYSPSKPETKCYKCHGSGSVTCSQCDGSGHETRYVSSPNFSGSTRGSNSASTNVTCGKCHGSGSVTCPACHGSGTN